MVGEYNTSNALQRRYVFGPDGDEPLVWYERSGTTDRRWLHADERGSVTAISDGSGNPIAIDSYDEYGTPASGNIGRFQYTGQMWLSELGSGPNALYHFKARTYSPRLGRFLQTDPIGLAGGINLYNYAGSDPVNHADPSGTAYDDDPIFGYPDYGGFNFVNFGFSDRYFRPLDIPLLNLGGLGVGQPPSPGKPTEAPIVVTANKDKNRSTGAAAQFGSIVFGAFPFEEPGEQTAGIGLSDAGPQKPAAEKKPPSHCQVTPGQSAATGGTAASTVALGELVRSGVKFLGRTGATTLLEEGVADEAGSALVLFGGPVTLPAVGIGGAVYLYDRYSGGQVTRFVSEKLDLGSGCK